ncbi:hypothetical protein BIV57_07095 [Mangrovactinospora gilvigrisea]|uniref:Uncharacterized protein n=1 Tax=Mangrovactinospora gilvigrisea TaxID=1428644 RepID=A0A1J7BHN1_9ACTN|nr:VC0807 family protein [Mangrovactinospora gilvigrisea]OIV38203.1 hypothetical protein BIV57_07095 [Mangrovactinospora gilvigrisea]
MTPISTSSAAPARTAPYAHLAPLVVDLVLPLAGYYLLSRGLGTSTTTALAVSSVPPALSTVWIAVRHRRLNALGALALLATGAGLALAAVGGDPRLMLAKDGLVSSVIGIAILLSVAAGRPLMSRVMRPMITKGDRARLAAWDRLSSGPDASAEFRAAERTFSLIWGGALLAECAARVVGAYTLPVGTMLSVHSLFVVAGVLAAVKLSKPHAERIGALLRQA